MKEENKKQEEIINVDTIRELDEYQTLMLAMDEEDLLMDEIENLIESIEDKKELEEIINKKYLPLLEKSKIKTQNAFSAWRKAVEKETKDIESLINNIEGFKEF